MHKSGADLSRWRRSFGSFKSHYQTCPEPVPSLNTMKPRRKLNSPRSPSVPRRDKRQADRRTESSAAQSIIPASPCTVKLQLLTWIRVYSSEFLRVNITALRAAMDGPNVWSRYSARCQRGRSMAPECWAHSWLPAGWHNNRYAPQTHTRMGDL